MTGRKVGILEGGGVGIRVQPRATFRSSTSLVDFLLEITLRPLLEAVVHRKSNMETPSFTTTARSHIARLEITWLHGVKRADRHRGAKMETEVQLVGWAVEVENSGQVYFKAVYTPLDVISLIHTMITNHKCSRVGFTSKAQRHK